MGKRGEKRWSSCKFRNRFSSWVFGSRWNIEKEQVRSISHRDGIPKRIYRDGTVRKCCEKSDPRISFTRLDLASKRSSIAKEATYKFTIGSINISGICIGSVKLKI